MGLGGVLLFSEDQKIINESWPAHLKGGNEKKMAFLSQK
jgi:hypothetical protein